MSLLEEELSANFSTFSADWQGQVRNTWAALSAEKLFLESYRRLSALNAVKNTLVVPKLSAGSAAFFLEAHNDALTSHVAASSGSWRLALQSLRSCIENALNSVYFMDHPVELQQWTSGEFKLGFTELHSYVVKHPSVGGTLKNVAGLDTLKEEYATLSKAVHASTVNFRMTEPHSSVLLWSADKARASMWATREKKVIEGLASLFIVLFRDQLTGAKNISVRDVLYFAVSATRRTQLKSRVHVTIARS